MVARQALAPYDLVIVLYGDAPLITSRDHQEAARLSYLQKSCDDGAHRRGGKSHRLRKNCSQEGRQRRHPGHRRTKTSFARHSRRSTRSTAAFTLSRLNRCSRHIDKLSTDNHHGEFYLTDMAAILGKSGQRVVAVQADNPHEVLGGNTRAEAVGNRPAHAPGEVPRAHGRWRHHSLP